MPITITLEAQHWNQIMALIAEQPYKVAAPFILEIQKQLNIHQQMSQRANGGEMTIEQHGQE